MRRSPVLLLVCLALGLSTLALGGDGVTVDDPSNSLVFGFIDMSDAPTGVSGATMMQLEPPTDAPYWSMGVEDGLFYNVFMKPGIYQMSSFFGASAFKGQFEYGFGRQGRNETAVEIQVPGIYYVGSYKYVDLKKGGMFQRRKFDIVPVESPSEAELLQRILDDTMRIQKSKEYDGPRKVQIRETIWAAKIEARLAELR